MAENILIQQYLGDGGQYQELNPVFVDKEINARLGLSSDFNSKSWIDLYSQFWWKKRYFEKHYEENSVVKSVEKYDGETDYFEWSSIAEVKGSSYTYILQYADEIAINQDTGEMNLVSPESVKLIYGTTTSSDIPNIVRKYATYLDEYGKIKGYVYIPESSTIKYKNRNNTYYLYSYPSMNIITTRRKDIIREWEYLQSKNKNAYLKNGIQNNAEYQFLGNPLKDFQIQSKIDCGSYIGAGDTPSESSPISLTFDFLPKFIFIAPDEFQKYGDSNVWSNYYNCIFWTPRITKVQFFNYNKNSFRYFNLDGLTFSFYDVVGDGGYPTLNSYGVNYNYVAFG